NNLKVYEIEIKVQSSSSSNSHNVAFVSSENTSSTNEAVNTAHEVSTASSQGQASSLSYSDDVMFFFFVNQSNSPQLDNEDLEQIDTDNLNFNGKETVGFDKTKVECYNWYRRGHFARECRVPRNQGTKMEIIQEGLYLWRLMLMPWLLLKNSSNLMIKPRTRVRCGL
ncbi:putative ribonuclease H-like domain-containing protein, partial [Tanacetum coccineum]